MFGLLDYSYGGGLMVPGVLDSKKLSKCEPWCNIRPWWISRKRCPCEQKLVEVKTLHVVSLWVRDRQPGLPPRSRKSIKVVFHQWKDLCVDKEATFHCMAESPHWVVTNTQPTHTHKSPALLGAIALLKSHLPCTAHSVKNVPFYKFWVFP